MYGNIDGYMLHKIVNGIKYCNGKEDWKYLNASGCSCMTTLRNEIKPYLNRIIHLIDNEEYLNLIVET